MALEFILDILFPARCANCSAPASTGSPLCGKCLATLSAYKTFFCGRCLARLPEGKKICHPEHPYILGAALDYRNKAVSAAIKSLKFKRFKATGPFLADILAKYLKSLPKDISSFVIVPIPLGKERLRERGFNQAELIAAPLARSLSLELYPTALHRVKNSKPQSEIKSHKERAENVAGIFLADESVAGKNIILLDDVTTSGSTMLQAALALKTAGARTILGLAAARA